MFPSVPGMPVVVGDCRIDNMVSVRQADPLAAYSEVCTWQAE